MEIVGTRRSEGVRFILVAMTLKHELKNGVFRFYIGARLVCACVTPLFAAWSDSALKVS